MKGYPRPICNVKNHHQPQFWNGDRNSSNQYELDDGRLSCGGTFSRKKWRAQHDENRRFHFASVTSTHALSTLIWPLGSTHWSNCEIPANRKSIFALNLRPYLLIANPSKSPLDSESNRSMDLILPDTEVCISSTNRWISSRSPSTTILTLPSSRFSTVPETTNDWAISLVR